MGRESGDVTRLIERWQQGREGALDELMKLVYEELKKLARKQMRSEKPDHTLQPTALANEAFLLLVNQKRLRVKERGYFFGLVQELMRRLLVDHARKRDRLKRGGGEKPTSLEAIGDIGVADQSDLRRVGAAIEDLAGIRPLQAEIVRLHFFSGYTHKEVAERLGISHARVRREWAAAREWLSRALSPA